MENRTASGIILPQDFLPNANTNGSSTSTHIPTIPPDLNFDAGHVMNDVNESNSTTTSSTIPSSLNINTSTTRQGPVNNQYLNYIAYVDERLREVTDTIKAQYQEAIENKISSLTSDIESRIDSSNNRISRIEERFQEGKEDKKHNQVIMITIITALVTVVLPILTGVAVITTGKYNDINDVKSDIKVINEKLSELNGNSDDAKKDIKDLQNKYLQIYTKQK